MDQANKALVGGAAVVRAELVGAEEEMAGAVAEVTVMQRRLPYRKRAEG